MMYLSIVIDLKGMLLSLAAVHGESCGGREHPRLPGHYQVRGYWSNGCNGGKQVYQFQASLGMRLPSFTHSTEIRVFLSVSTSASGNQLDSVQAISPSDYIIILTLWYIAVYLPFNCCDLIGQ